jgi:NADH-quinone oxidoreductase subunit E
MCNTVVQDIFDKYRDASRDSLIPLLQDIQEADGYLSRERISEVGDLLNLPASKIYGVATFYNQFRFQPRGKYHIQVCRGTACHVKGSAAVLEAIEKRLEIKAGETDRTGLFSLEVVACIGACGLAPVISVNGEFHAGVSPDDVKTILDQYSEKDGGSE